MILYAADLQIGKLYQYHGYLSPPSNEVARATSYEVALYNEINEHVLKPVDAIIFDVFVLLEKEERGFPYHGRYWCKILTSTGIVGWIIYNLDSQFEELKDVCMGT